MPLLDLRELRSFPSGDNNTDTLINGVHFNLTALKYYNYTVYSNNTISNRSRCYLIFDQYQPTMFSNGSWVNGTSCYVPYYGIKARGAIGIGFAALFAASIMFTLINLRKHGRMFLREDKRFRIIGRRWQWYWMCFVAACGIISTITGVDVDRDYLQQLAIVLQSFFYCLMLPGTLAMVWEATRHWGSWQERQICDRDPFLLPQDDKRGQFEFWIPLVFYMFAWLNFFMVIPRSWTALEYQRSPWQQSHYAQPSATDSRHKAGAIIAFCAWVVIIVSLHHSLHHYRPRTTGLWNRFNTFCHYCPTKLFLYIIILGIRVIYAIASAWIWEINLFKYDVEPGWPYGLGYGTTALLLIMMNIYGYVDENEDRLLIQQRQERGRSADAELGLTKKPHWWAKARGDTHLSPEQRLRALATEGPGGRAALPRANVELQSFALPSHYSIPSQAGRRSTSELSSDDIERAIRRLSEDPFHDPPLELEEGGMGARVVRRGENNDAASTRTADTARSGMTGQTLTENYPPQRVRSMLDI
ncbi:uncharacterized protein K452DRAFT_316589 [Aplosporella prunicola CBS 121167]|uniref:Uncharacterized protein n=1 Tax=Aplosporella prunicola CBS 121167 TaxID=1176127 RepID=A0A6A6BMJ7_9PEZI|nr:uncharacterized protein K452DRAFT_316589 [Aplosporella prunicola CBS 121167]KAF2144633.1 hypothetical protein K452DRAFT_316589 [Aplosporella prunicola CBS 121167]